MENIKQIRGRKTNHRKHPGIKGRRPDKKDRRIVVAEENKVKWEKLTPDQQLAVLNEKLGKGVGAKKQRARLNKIIAESEEKTSKKQKRSKHE